MAEFVFSVNTNFLLHQLLLLGEMLAKFVVNSRRKHHLSNVSMEMEQWQAGDRVLGGAPPPGPPEEVHHLLQGGQT